MMLYFFSGNGIILSIFFPSFLNRNLHKSRRLSAGLLVCDTMRFEEKISNLYKRGLRILNSFMKTYGEKFLRATKYALFFPCGCLILKKPNIFGLSCNTPLLVI